MEDLKIAAEKVVAAWKELPDADREAFNNAAGPLVSELRGLNTILEAGFSGDGAEKKGEDTAANTTAAAAPKVGDVCTLAEGGEGVLEESTVDGVTSLVCVAKAA